MLVPAFLYVILSIPSDKTCTAQLDQLLSLYREYALPLPPPDAPLVRFVYGPYPCFTKDGDLSEMDGLPGVGFALSNSTVLVGASEHSSLHLMTVIKPDLTSLGQDIRLRDLHFAIQCHARGWEQLARA